MAKHSAAASASTAMRPRHGMSVLPPALSHYTCVHALRNNGSVWTDDSAALIGEPPREGSGTALAARSLYVVSLGAPPYDLHDGSRARARPHRSGKAEPAFLVTGPCARGLGR